MRAALLVATLAACGNGHEVAVDAIVIDAVPADATQSLGVDVPLASLDAITYTMMLGIGDQQFAQIVDTGSAMTGVAAATCTECAGVMPLYVPGTTAIDKLATAATEYADLSTWSGEIYQDHATVPGVPTVLLELVAVSSEDQFFMGNSYQGIVGLGPRQLLEPGTNEYMDLVAVHGVPDEMAFRLCPDRGDLWIGGFDPTAATQPVQWTPMLPVQGDDPFYSTQISDIAFGDADLGLDTNAFGTAIVDTGTSISFVPSGTDAVMLAAINANAAFLTLFGNQTLAQGVGGSCVTTAGVTSAMVDAMLPPLVISFPSPTGGTFSLSIPPSRSYLIGSGNGQFCWAFGISDDVLGGGSLIGDSLLAGMLAVFDIDDQLMGFAPEAGCNEAVDDRVRPRPLESPYYRPPPRRARP